LNSKDSNNFNIKRNISSAIKKAVNSNPNLTNEGNIIKSTNNLKIKQNPFLSNNSMINNATQTSNNYLLNNSKSQNLLNLKTLKLKNSNKDNTELLKQEEKSLTRVELFKNTVVENVINERIQKLEDFNFKSQSKKSMDEIEFHLNSNNNKKNTNENIKPNSIQIGFNSLNNPTNTFLHEENKSNELIFHFNF
jgi:protease II